MGREFKTNIIKEAMKNFNEIIEKKIFFDFRKNLGLTLESGGEKENKLYRAITRISPTIRTWAVDFGKNGVLTNDCRKCYYCIIPPFHYSWLE